MPSQMTMGIDMGILDNKPAAAMARDQKQYLKHPDKLFRRVRDEHGILQLSKNAAATVPAVPPSGSPSSSSRRSPVSVALRSALERILKRKGLLGDWEEGQDIISRWEELVQMSRKKKSASETVVPGEDSPFKATAVSKTDVAKIENNLEALVKESENLSGQGCRLSSLTGVFLLFLYSFLTLTKSGDNSFCNTFVGGF